MKYWRGYLVAAIIAACTWGLEEFGKSHAALVDMIYPYVTRMAQTYLADWSGAVDFLLWQVLLVAFGVLVLASVVLMVTLKWNPVQWFGWVLAAASIAVLLNTGMYGLNTYAGSIGEDIRLEDSDYMISELESAAEHYRNKANKLAGKLENSPESSFQQLNAQAPEGFDYMKTQAYQSVFAGSTSPVKELGFAELFAQNGVDSIHVGLTGEAAVNPLVPYAAKPMLICEQMAKRMCIASEADAEFAAFLTCRSNSSPEFQYSAYLSAYRACCALLAELEKSTGDPVAQQVREKAHQKLAADDEALSAFYGENVNMEQTEALCDLLVSLYIQEEIVPLHLEEEVLFDPMDETQVDLSGIVNAG